MTSKLKNLKPISKARYIHIFIQLSNVRYKSYKNVHNQILFTLYKTVANRHSNYEVKEQMHLFFSSIDELFQSNNRNEFLLNTMYFVIRFKDFSCFWMGFPNKGRKITWDKIMCDIKKYCYFDIPIETDECSKEW